MPKPTVIIGVDTGNRCIKSPNSVFVAGLTQVEDNSFFQRDTLIYNGVKYALTPSRIVYRRDKTEDESYFVLTLFAILRELKARQKTLNLNFDEPVPITLAVGLPPSDYASLKVSMEQYFSRGCVPFQADNRVYTIIIDEVMVFPQGYPAARFAWSSITSLSRAYIIDIGGYTTDVIGMISYKNKRGEMTLRPDPNCFYSLNYGMIMLYNLIKLDLSKSGYQIAEEQIDEMLKTGREMNEGLALLPIVRARAQDYIANLVRQLTELGIDLRAYKGVFVGGGSIRLEGQIRNCQQIQNPNIVTEIRANAIGFERLAAKTLAARNG